MKHRGLNKYGFIGTLWKEGRKFHKNSNLAILLNNLYDIGIMQLYGELKKKKVKPFLKPVSTQIEF